MAELRAFYVNPSKIPDEPLEVVFAYHCTVPRLVLATLCDANSSLVFDIKGFLSSNFLSFLDGESRTKTSWMQQLP